MRCQVRRCKCEVYLIFYGRGVCEEHWSKHCDNVIDLKREFKIKESNSDEVLIDREGEIKVFDDWKNYFSL